MESAAFGWKNGKFAACLSGNPASALTCFYAVALPVLRRLCGREQAALPEVSARLGADFKKGGKQTRLVRGRLSADEYMVWCFIPPPSRGTVRCTRWPEPMRWRRSRPVQAPRVPGRCFG